MPSRGPVDVDIDSDWAFNDYPGGTSLDNDHQIQLLHGTTKWMRTDHGGYKTSFSIPVMALKQLSDSREFAIDWQWPHSGSGFDPSMVFGTLGLKEGISGILR